MRTRVKVGAVRNRLGGRKLGGRESGSGEEREADDARSCLLILSYYVLLLYTFVGASR